MVDGISYRNNAGGVARNNECIGNGEDGIYVDSTACPMLRDNRCRGNKGREVNDRRRWFRRRWC
jgi:nitrous oxidase accessory protein NosD